MALARRDGDDATTPTRRLGAPIEESRNLRADGPPPVVNGKLKLLVKYKNDSYRRLSLGDDHVDNGGSPDSWPAHALSMYTISKERHIAEVEIDANERDLVTKEMMSDVDVELVEEVRS